MQQQTKLKEPKQPAVLLAQTRVNKKHREWRKKTEVIEKEVKQPKLFTGQDPAAGDGEAPKTAPLEGAWPHTGAPLGIQRWCTGAASFYLPLTGNEGQGRPFTSDDQVCLAPRWTKRKTKPQKPRKCRKLTGNLQNKFRFYCFGIQYILKKSNPRI